MIEVLFLLIFWEAVVIVILLFKTPFRKLLILTLDRLKRARGPLVLNTAAASLVTLLLSGVYGIINIQRRQIHDDGHVHLNPTDQLLMANHLLQTTLIGAVLFLAVIIDRLHHCMRELRIRRKNLVVMKRLEATKALEEERDKLKVELIQLESDLNSKAKDVDVAEANVTALRKQFQGFLLEYQRVLEENHNLRKKLQVLDRRLSHSVSKKNM
ncbi:hypothetical protein HN51_063528 [Arachis hypogaea]|uniref:Endoplasmic reticulum transmembrane protein n=1 Tax=Arachis hypogaea TaxID=3818 RepID=A0A445AXM1_ARAHY|nr:uncharacterized protein LOC107636321 isoform X2 [Arachis ipaensis]XP_025629849.1 uncharacterized protein LOC112722880 isoform X2 [Arachis hypogaea]QHO21132.1 B-cell receptor-associated protein [Arachis hypogaea]RYR31194.1 hypothetical protein Ahy_B01g055987 [Arachis hypogaea]